MFETLQLCRKVSLDLLSPYATAFSFIVDGAQLTSAIVNGSAGRQRVEIALPLAARGYHVRARLNAIGPVRLYAVSVWARGLGAAASDWAWRPLPVRATPDEYLARGVPIRPTPEEFGASRVPIRPTPEEFGASRVPIRPTPEAWSQSALPMPAASPIRQFVSLPLDE
jgi:hypothetical protein